MFYILLLFKSSIWRVSHSVSSSSTALRLFCHGRFFKRLSRLIGSAGKVGVSCYMWWTIINSVCWLDGDKPSFLSVNLHWLSLTRRRTWYWSGLKPVSGPSLSPGPGWRLKYIYFFIEHWLGGQDQVCCQKVAGLNPNFAVVFWGRTKMILLRTKDQ